MSSPFAKIFLFSPDPNQFTDSHRPVPQRGVAQRHQRGAGCGGRGSAFDEWRCSRTAKSCRSDAPMQASSLREAAQATVSNKLGHRGEREVSRKTIARGMPGRSGVTVVTNSRVFYYTRGCGRIERPAFPAPSDLRRRDVSGKTRAERAARSRSCVWRTRGCLKFESVKVFGACASFPSPLVGEGARAKRGRVRGFSPRMQTPHPSRCSLRSHRATLSHRGRREEAPPHIIPKRVSPNSAFCVEGCERQYCGGASTWPPSSAAACQPQRGS